MKYIKYIIASFFTIILVKILIVDLYYVPTSSMEDTLPRKSYIIVSKYNYGAKLPRSTYEIPYLSGLFKQFEPLQLWENVRTIGFGGVGYDDIILAQFNNTKLIKRVVGLPGDTININNGLVTINSSKELIKDSYLYVFSCGLQKQEVEEIGKIAKIHFRGDQNYDIYTNGKSLRILVDNFPHLLFKAKFYKKDTMESEGTYPKLKRGTWNRNYFGDFIVPYKGMEIELSNYNYSLYKETLEKYEELTIYNVDSLFIINGKIRITYTFKKDYFFLLGDNRMESIDSRFLGVFPKRDILGKLKYWF